jgi:hypothetical protein
MASDDDWACPHCHEPLPGQAKFCRHCGASDESGWGQDGLGFAAEPADGYGYDSEDDFDYDDFVAREFPDQAERKSSPSQQKSWIWLIIGLVCLGLVLTAILSSMAGG